MINPSEREQITYLQNNGWNTVIEALPFGHYADGKLADGRELRVFRSWSAIHDVATARRIDNLHAWRKA